MTIYSCTIIKILGSPLCQIIMFHEPHSRNGCKWWAITSPPWSDKFRLNLYQTWVSSKRRPRSHSLCIRSKSPCHTNTTRKLPLKWRAVWPSPRSSSLCQRSRPWTGSWCRETSLRSWTAPWGRGTARAHPHTLWRGISPGEEQNNTRNQCQQPWSRHLIDKTKGGNLKSCGYLASPRPDQTRPSPTLSSLIERNWSADSSHISNRKGKSEARG